MISSGSMQFLCTLLILISSSIVRTQAKSGTVSCCTPPGNQLHTKSGWPLSSCIERTNYEPKSSHFTPSWSFFLSFQVSSHHCLRTSAPFHWANVLNQRFPASSFHLRLHLHFASTSPGVHTSKPRPEARPAARGG